MSTEPATSRHVRVLDGLDAHQLSSVRRLLAVAHEADGTAAVNEQTLLAIEAGDEQGARHLLGTTGAGGAEAVVAYAHLDLPAAGSGADIDPLVEASAECVVHPEHRRRGWGGALLRRLLDESAPHPLLVWAHGDHPGAAALARSLRLDRVRELWQMRRDLTEPLPNVELPAGVHVRTFVVGVDEPEWLAMNARAFADHPEQGGIDAADLARRTAAEWFDADGFFLAERDSRPVGFHWTKVHPADDSRPPVGEVYVVGVDPAAQGGGLGRALTLVGLHHLRDRGLGEVLLYVEGDNLPARRVYERLGFARVATDVQYRSHP